MYTMLSKLKEAFGRRSTENSQNKEDTTVNGDEESNDEKPKTEVEELLAQYSQVDKMDSQDCFSDSPVLFPSQEYDDKQKKKEDNDEDSDCYEIVDKTSSEKDTNNARNPKNKGRLSLPRKRRMPETTSETTSTNSKQRKVAKEDDNINLHNKTISDNHKEPCKHLIRVYSYRECPCRSLQEADANDLYFAPRHVDPASYQAVIVRKFEHYRRNLRRIQSGLVSRHKYGKGIDPVSGRSRGRTGGRVKRTAEVKKITPENKSRAANKKAAEVVHVDPFEDFETLMESKQRSKADDVSKQRSKADDVLCTKVSPRKSSKTAEPTSNCETTSKTTSHADVNSTNDVVMETVNNDDSTASPVKPVLDEKHRKAILEEVGSDDDTQNFDLIRPVFPEETGKEEPEKVEADCVEVLPTTVAKEPTRVECPMCYKEFPTSKIEEHAFACNGLDQVSTSTRSARTVDSQDGQMSPVIKTRTPTKVKELKLLTNVKQANEFSAGKKEVKRNSTGGINVEVNSKQNKRRISLEPSIKLKHVDSPGLKCGQSKTTGKLLDIEDDESTPLHNIQETLQRKRLTLSNTRKNLEKRSFDASTMKRNFIPLEFESENEKIPSKDVHKVLSLIDENSSESSDEELNAKKSSASKKKSIVADDDMSALSLMATDYKSRKRKNTKRLLSNLKKAKVTPREEPTTEHCFLCGKDIPISEYTKHVDEEIARQTKEDDAKYSDLSTMSSCFSQNTEEATECDGTNMNENTTSSGSRLPLPDLAEATTRPTNDESPLKTFTPLNQGSDYHKQFSFSNDRGQSNGNRGQGRGQRRGKRRTRRRR